MPSRRGAWHDSLADAPRIVEVVSDAGPQLDRAITHTFPMDHVQSAFEPRLAGRRGKAILYT